MMDTIIPAYYKEYGMYSNAFRNFPLDIDGLKPVERRILLTAFLVAKEKLVKSARIEGTCMAKFHPHAGAYGTIVQMVNQGFLTGQGNFGFNLGVEPVGFAAQRYTECGMKKSTLDMAFRYLKHVDWVESELDDEPEFLPTMFPFCLMGDKYTEGIGFGYRTVIPCYEVKDLYARLLWLIGKSQIKPTIKPITDCIIDSNNEVLETLLTTGKAKIELHGVLKVNRGLCKATVKSWPPGKKFETILSKFKKELDISDIGYMDLSNEDDGTNVSFSVLKQRNRDKIFSGFVSKLKTLLIGSVSFDIILSSKEEVVRKSVDSMLLDTYNKFISVNDRMLRYEIAKANDSIVEFNNLEKLKGPLAQVLQAGQITKDNMSQKIGDLARLSQLSTEIVNELITKYRINKLFTVNTDTTNLQNKVVECQVNLNDIQTFVLGQYNNI